MKIIQFLFVSTLFFFACDKEETIDPIQISSVVQNVSVYGQSDGSIILTVTGGKEPFTFKWSNGITTKDLSNIPIGSYTVVVKGANGDTASHSVNVTEPTELLVNYTKTNANQTGTATGKINVSISGGIKPYSVLCNNQTVDTIITSLSAGNYTIKVTDANQAIEEFDVTIADPVTLKFNVTNTSTYNGNDGAINLSITGGIAPYTVVWNTNETSEDLSGLKAGFYTATVTDAENTVIKRSTTVFEPYDKTSETANIVNSIERLTNAGIRIVYNSKIIYIDPIVTGGYSADADIILVTHSHSDHLNESVIKTLANSGTLLAGPSDCKSIMSSVNGSANFSQVAPEDSINLVGFPINVVYAYNIVNSFHSSPTSVGYIITINGKRIYHAGDTERIPEMTSYNADIAIIPLGQMYTFIKLSDAADAARDIKAEIVIPIHYGNMAAEGNDNNPWNIKEILKEEIDVVVKPINY